jgi:hypothetical protein
MFLGINEMALNKFVSHVSHNKIDAPERWGKKNSLI